MLTLAAYGEYVSQERSALWYLVVLVAGWRWGLTANPTLVAVPVVLLLLDFWPLGRFGIAAEASRARR